MAYYLVQHGKAHSKEDDPEQGLTEEGIQETLKIAQLLLSKTSKILTLRTSNNPVIARQRSCRGNPENKAFRLNQYTNPPRVDLISQSKSLTTS